MLITGNKKFKILNEANSRKFPMLYTINKKLSVKSLHDAHCNTREAYFPTNNNAYNS